MQRKSHRDANIEANSTDPIFSHVKTSPRPPKAALQVPSSTTKPPTFPENIRRRRRRREETRFANGNAIPRYS